MTSELEARYVEYVQARMTWLHHIAYLLTHDSHRADDLVQATITTLYVKWRRISKMDNIDGYVRRMLTRTFLAEMRGRWAKTALVGTAPAEQSHAEPDLARRLTLQAMLADLPPRQRAVVVLRFFCDLSVEQTADELNLSPGTVKSHTSRALNSLRHLFAAPDLDSLMA